MKKSKQGKIEKTAKIPKSQKATYAKASKTAEVSNTGIQIITAEAMGAPVSGTIITTDVITPESLVEYSGSNVVANSIQPLAETPVSGDGQTDYSFTADATVLAVGLAASKFAVPHHLTVDVRLDSILAFYTPLNEVEQVTIDSFLIKAAASAMKKFPAVNAAGTFTIVNLGQYGIKSVAAIVQEPQVCVLAIGAAEKRVVPGNPTEEDDAIYELATYLTATLSCDHRVIDGAVSAQWLAAFKGLAEEPDLMSL